MTSTNNTYKLNKSELAGEIRDCLAVINRVALTHSINYLVVGATARDFVFEHLFRIGIERATRDLDITIDIVPFGGLSNEQGDIALPPDEEFKMSVLGFDEAYHHAINIEFDEGVVVPTASPEGLSLLKLISWLDRETDKRQKDATDLWFLIQNFHKLPWVEEPIYDTPYMENNDFDVEKASAEFLANQIFDIADKNSIDFIQQNLLENELKQEELVREMGSKDEDTLESRNEIMSIIFRVLFERSTGISE